MKLGKKFLSALLFAVLLFGAWGTARGENYREGEVLVVLRGTPPDDGGEVRAQSRKSRETSAADIAESVAESLNDTEIAAVHGYMTPESDQVFALFKSDTKTTGELIEELKSNPDVLAVSPNHVMRALGDPPGYETGAQWGLDAINARRAWSWDGKHDDGKENWGNRKIYVAVFDTGIATDHPGFNENGSSNLEDRGYSKNFIKYATSTDIADTYGHGTQVSGIIGGAIDTRALGVSPRVSLITLKVLEKNEGYTDDLIKALSYVSQELIRKGVNIKAVNLSLGWEMSGEKPSDLLDSPVYRAFKELDSLKNAPVIVAAAGNDGYEVGKPRVGKLDAPGSFTGLKNLIIV